MWSSTHNSSNISLSIGMGLDKLTGSGPFITQGRRKTRRHKLKKWNFVEIEDSKIHPEWNQKDGIVIERIKSKTGEIFYFIAVIQDDESIKTGYVEMKSLFGWKWTKKEFKTKIETLKYTIYKMGYHHNTRYCANCGISKKKRKLKGCKGCADIKYNYRIRYCSRKCQSKDWKRHKEICVQKGRKSKSKVCAENDLLALLLLGK